ncbi:MAG TPA: hypothetical protein VEX86_04480 [Longimicrobium sp.]|nr:hypothetical protein [Longimicrobium sp.]
MSGALFFCGDERRRAQLRFGGSGLAGIDFLEVGDLGPELADAQRLLRVAFVNPPAVGSTLRDEITPETVTVTGGDRVRGIRATNAWFDGDELRVEVDRAGDFTTYTLRIQGRDGKPLAGMDPLLSSVGFSFKAGCAAGADCEVADDCPAEPDESAEIDYLAKDYNSFRQLMLDRMSLLLPGWTERNPADLGITLVELLAYVGDHLSYRQDAIATEAYLGTARRRISVRRHARLLDYPMHDGCNARVWVHVEVRPRDPAAVYDPHDETADDDGDVVILPPRAQLLTRLPGRAAVIDDVNEQRRALADHPEAFETLHQAELRPRHGRISFYTWGERDCCLPRGATRATLAGHYPRLKPGDVLVLEEVLGPLTGAPGDADPAHRHAVRLTEAGAYVPATPGEEGGEAPPLSDPAFLYGRAIAGNLKLKDAGGTVLRTLSAGEVVELLPDWAGVDKLFGKREYHVVDAAGVEGFVVATQAQLRLYSPRLTEVAWAAEDALPFALCVSATTDAQHGARHVADVSVARANVVLADHGLTVEPEDLGTVPLPDPRLAPAMAGAGGCGCSGETEAIAPPARFRPRLTDGPVTQAARVLPPGGAAAADEPPFFDPAAPAATAFRWEMGRVLPAITLYDERESAWLPQRDLLASDPFAREFVLEVEDDGQAHVRFGDDRYAQRPAAGGRFTAVYRVGNGTRGNVGADSLVHLILPDAIDAARDDGSGGWEIAPVGGEGPRAALSGRLAARNPLAARGGTDPEDTERVRQIAPAAFRDAQRCVTPGDYAATAERHPEVQRAQATLRWTGSWRTVFLTVDRAGGRPVDAAFEAELRRFLERFRLAGHDLEVESPRFVALEVEVFACVDGGYFRADVERALRQALGSRTLPDGRRGLFHPDNFTFGQSVFLSRVYAAAQAVPGVRWAEVRAFGRQGDPRSSVLETGELKVGRLEIARMDDDPSHPDRGVLRLKLTGGR